MHRILVLRTFLTCSAFVSGATGCAQTNANNGGSSAPDDAGGPLDATSAADGYPVDSAPNSAPDGDAADAPAGDAADWRDGATFDASGGDAGMAVDASWTGRPPAAPLFVRNPYLSIWSAADSVSGTWPTLWSGQIKGMTGIARIDGAPYVLIGALSPSNVASLGKGMTLVSRALTPTKTEYVLSAGGVAVTLDFLSPVEIRSLERQSAPIAYLTMSATATDGNSHAVSLYVDMSGEWANGDSTQLVQWQRETVPHQGGTLVVQSITSSSPKVLSETNSYVQWGTAFMAADSANLTSAIGADAHIRAMAADTGALDGSVDSNMPRAIDNAWPVLGFAFDLGTVGAAPSQPQVVEVGLARDPAVSYQTKPVAPLWKAYWSTWEAMASDAYDDADGAASRATDLDARIVSDARAVAGDHYAALCTLAVRQAFGGTELVGTASDPWLFLKEISSDGNVSTVDVTYPASPVFLYANPYLLRLLLQPVLEYAESGLWPQAFAEHDIGASYPNADGHNLGGGENEPVEETSDMLLMMAAYARRANAADAQSYAQAHYALIKQWADYVVAYGPDPVQRTLADGGTIADQQTTDVCRPFLNHNANLGLKAVLAVGAMGILAEAAGNAADAAAYSSKARSLMAQWVTNSTDATGTHTLFAYDQPSSWGQIWSALYDKLLGLNLVPASLLATDATYYRTKQALAFGIPMDSRFVDPAYASTCPQNAVKTDFPMWMAAAAGDPDLTTTLVEGIYAYATNSSDRVPFSDLYGGVSGQRQNPQNFEARPVQGAIFSLLATSGAPLVAQ